MIKTLLALAIATASTGCAAISTEVQISYQSGGTTVSTVIRR